jgi:hypothetical protein
MRRWFVLYLSVASVPAIGVGAVALPSAAAATPASRLIVCPLARARFITCCGPPVANGTAVTPIQPSFCCPPIALCAIGLTIDSTPDPSTAGGPITISGRLLGLAQPGTPVVLWSMLPDQRLHRVLQTSTNAAGEYAIVRGPGAVETNRQWYVTARGSRSRTVTQSVHALVTLVASAPGAAPGDRLTFSGHVRPADAGRRVLLEQHSDRGWLVIARPRLGRASSFTVDHAFAHDGSTEVRVVLPGDVRNLRSSSAVLRIAVSGVHTHTP